MADSLRQLVRLLDEDHVEEPQPRRRNRNARAGAPRENSPIHSFSNSGTQNMEGLINDRNARAGAPRENSPTHSFSNSGTQNMEGLINNTGFVVGNGNGSIIFGSFDSTTRTYN